MEKKRVIVTGGGASGLMAAIAAAENGAAVTILEQNEKPGKKICATGNGKCNFTNIQVPSDAYRSENPGFEQAVLNQFPVKRRLSLSSQRTGSKRCRGIVYGSTESWGKDQDQPKSTTCF